MAQATKAAKWTDEEVRELRTTLIERWVFIDAFEMLLNEVVLIGPDDDSRANALFPSVLTDDNLNVNLGGDELAGQLWPTKEELDHSLESRTAQARSASIAAAYLATLATEEGRNDCAEKASRLAAFAAGTLAKGVEA